ncbi:MAG TPA: type II secretion system protein [Peptostreptococcaceae bacterium]|nr:type II secretion system protein [Peptostreptococcaceae bacterium]
MSRKRGYLLLESVLYLAILSLIIGMVYNLVFFNLNSLNTIQNNIEIQQQGYTIKNHIKSRLMRASNIESVKTINNKVSSIKYNIDKRSDEFYLNPYTKKLFYRKNCLAPGYELGDYIDNIEIENLNNGNLIKIRLYLSKKNNNIETEFVVDLKNYGG